MQIHMTVYSFIPLLHCKQSVRAPRSIWPVTVGYEREFRSKSNIFPILSFKTKILPPCQPTTVTVLDFRMSLRGVRGIKIETVIVGYCECPPHIKQTATKLPSFLHSQTSSLYQEGECILNKYHTCHH